MITDRERFLRLCETVTADGRERAGIGTLSEKTLHAMLKCYFEPDINKHEVRVGRYVADIASDSGIIEIQTRSFNSLRAKLSEFLKAGAVTVVHPIPYTKWLCWIDCETGQTTKRRKSPKTGSVCDSLRELYKIKPLLKNENIRLCLVLINLTEYRLLNGWSSDKKRGSVRQERLPEDIVDEVYITSLEDFKKLLPPVLPEEFTVKEFAKSAGISLRSAQEGVNTLNFLGAIARVGKRGNSYLYSRA